MTDPTNALVGSRVRLTEQTGYPDVEGEVAIVGVPEGHTEPWAVVLAETEDMAYAFPVASLHFEEVEAPRV